MIKVAILLALAALTGCASCNPATFVKPTPINPENNIKVISAQSYVAVFKIENIQLVIDGICSELSEGVCGVISAPEGTRVRFEDNKFIHIDATANQIIETYVVTSISYSMLCEYKNKSEYYCSSSEVSPTLAKITRKESDIRIAYDGGSYFRSITNSFDPTVEFYGAKQLNSTKPSLISRTDDRQYHFTITEKSLLHTAPSIIQLPRLVVNGKTYDLPPIKFTTVNEELCHFTELM